jgi:CubicO group peptidase (beta-lactamase class C family)
VYIYIRDAVARHEHEAMTRPAGHRRRPSRRRRSACRLYLHVLSALVSIALMPAALIGQASHDTALDARVDAYVASELAAQHIPGIALGVMRDGHIIKARGYGLANVELNVPVTPQSIFQTGSVGKQFTAALVMMLVEDGTLGLDDKIAKYFPDAPAAWHAITIRQLLTHTSGIPDYGAEENTMAKGVVDFRKDYSEDDLARIIAALPPEFSPGAKWKYSNSGYVLLGILIHRATGKFYGDLLRDRIFTPLGMTATRIISEADIIPHRSGGYRLVHGAIKNQDWVSPSLNTTADGALYTTVLDMAKWDAALYSSSLLKPATRALMWTPVRLNDGTTYPYGFGWGLATVKGHHVVQHGGAWQGFTTFIARYIDDHLTVVVLTNLDEDNANPNRIAAHVAALYLPALKVAESAK